MSIMEPALLASFLFSMQSENLKMKCPAVKGGALRAQPG